MTTRMEAIVTAPTKTVYGDRPSHKHKCLVGLHDWECNSPYCEVLEIECPDHGGPVPFVQGREPWRGRN